MQNNLYNNAMSKIFYFIILLFERAIAYFKTVAYSGIVEAKVGVKFFPSSKVINIKGGQTNIKIGKNTSIRGELLTFRHGGEIVIGDYCYVGEMTRIWSASKISIGNRVLIAHNVNIHDNNAHPIDAQQRHEQYKKIISSGHPKEDSTLNEKSIIIEDDVWIGFNSTILKGVTIGKGSIIAACTLITKDVPPFVIIAGNPAQIIKTLK